MVEEQLRAGGIQNERVLEAMGRVPREEFVPVRERPRAYADGAVSIGAGQTISQPWVVAAICAGLELRGGERVLEVGTGSGYSTAVISELVRPGGFVRSIELIAELADRARETLSRLGVEAVEVLTGDGATTGDGALDAIAVHAAAPRLPPGLARALRPAPSPGAGADEPGASRPGGRLVIPLADGGSDMLTAFRREDEGVDGEPRLARVPIAACRFVPLLGESGFSSPGR